MKRRMKKVRQIIHIRSLRFVLGCILAAAALAISLLVYGKAKAGLVFAVLFIMTGAVRIPEDMIPQRLLPILYTVWLVVTAFATLALSQFCLNEVLPENGLLPTVLGVALILALFLLPLVLTLKIRLTAIVVSSILIVFTCINYFVFLFRGSEIAPADILSITTAGNVAAEYSFRVPAAMFYALCLSAIYYFASFALPKYSPDKGKKPRLKAASALLVCVAAVVFGGLQINTKKWLQTGSVANGYLLNFAVLLRESFPTEPKEYSADSVDAVSADFPRDSEETNRLPDIIVIMDESFADLSILGNTLNVDTAVTPNIDSLHSNTLRGYTLSSVFGGGTPNSEYEFLTGNTFLFLPTGSIAYQQFIKTPCYSLARELKSRGYSTIAMHQYLPSSWMRERIWPMLGFEECLFLDSFPQKDSLRGWGTDQEMFETVVSVYEDHIAAADSPVFMFAVTIQNHGGYHYAESDFTPTVHLQGYSRAYPDVEQYLTCIHETDKAVRWLIDYYDQADRDVVILFYGDHYPKLDDAFYEEVHGGPFETLDERMLQYEVPFFIWTNYESESGETELVSMNFLAGLLYQKAGLPLPPYNRYLEQLREGIGACNALGYYSKTAGRFLPRAEAQGEEKQALLEYSYLEWNSLFDKDNTNEVFFPIN